LHIFCDDLPFDVACSKQSPTQPNPPPPPEQQSQKSNSNKTLQTGNSSFDLVHHQCSHSASSHPLSGDEHSSQKTNQFSKSIENDEETSARTKCNPNFQPKGLRETGATNDKSAAKHTFASVKVKIEGEAPDSNRRRNTETQKAPQCDADDSIMKAPQCPARTAGELSPWVSFIRQRRTSSPSSSERWNMATLGKQVYGGLWARFREEPGADNP